jgi:hypothetical protein
MYGAAAVLAGTLAYKAYSSNSVAQTRHSLARLRASLVKYSEALSSGADLCCTLVRDLQRFLQSDSTEVPGSLRQLAKLLQSQEVTQTTTKAVAAVYRGVAGKCRRRWGTLAAACLGFLSYLASCPRLSPEQYVLCSRPSAPSSLRCKALGTHLANSL